MEPLLMYSLYVYFGRSQDVRWRVYERRRSVSMSFAYKEARLIRLIIAIDNDFVVSVNYAAANLDDGEVLSDFGIKREELHVNGDSTFISFFLLGFSLIIH
jgi:hypothetical protein